jgi:hypothetical protein
VDVANFVDDSLRKEIWLGDERDAHRGSAGLVGRRAHEFNQALDFYCAFDIYCAVEEALDVSLASKIEDLVKDGLGRLLALLSGFTLESAGHRHGDGGIDGILRHGKSGQCVAVEVKRLGQGRAGDIQANLALASLQLSAAARAINAQPLLVLLMPLWSERAIGNAREFVAEYLSEFGWAILTDDGGFLISLPKLKIDYVSPPSVHSMRAPKSRQSTDLFTDANRWMLKILLLRNAPADFWGGPRELIGGVPLLSRIAGVTPESAYRFVKTLNANGFARVGRGSFQLVRCAALVEKWLAQDAARPLLWQPVRWRRGRPQDVEEVFASPIDAPRYAVTGFEACKSLGLLHASTPGTQIQVECSLDQAMRDWQLELASRADAHFSIAKARFPLSVFGGSVLCGTRTVVDALQAALDVRSSPGRGVEQSDYIVREVLGLLSEP